jgi:hypothetical protein
MTRYRTFKLGRYCVMFIRCADKPKVGIGFGVSPDGRGNWRTRYIFLARFRPTFVGW